MFRRLLLFRIWALTLLCLAPQGCADKSAVADEEEIKVVIAKWYDNHQAALSLTHDAGWLSDPKLARVNALIAERGLHLGYEMVTATFRERPELTEFFRATMATPAFSLFGHGDTHINHDALTADSAYLSFKRCFDTMDSLGLKPVGYAYPHGAGFKSATQEAVRRAGFLSARGFSFGEGYKSLIMPDSAREPENWYLLPSLVMQDYSFERCDTCINNNAEFAPYLDLALRHGAWLTVTYHAIGDERGWGFYKWSEFVADIEAASKRDFWFASLSAATLYVKERLAARATVVRSGEVLRVVVADGLNNARYNQPLTVLLSVPASWRGKSASLWKNGKRERRYVALEERITMNLLPDEAPYELALE